MAPLRNFFDHRPGISFLVSLTFSMTLFFFTPAFVFLQNFREIYLPFAHFCLYFLLFAFGAFVFLRFFLNRLPESLFRKVLPFLFASSVLFWVQGNLLPWNYGALDGSEIEWGAKLHYGLMDTVVWLGGLFFVWRWADGVYQRVLRPGCIALLLVQILALVTLSPPAWETPSYKNFLLLNDRKFNFSGEQNIIVLVLDSFPGDLFQEIIEEDPSFAFPFEGFIFFRNAIAEYPFTETSTFNLLTGERLDFAVPFQKQLRETYLNKSLPAKLRENGYSIDVFPDMRAALYFAPELISNIRPRTFGDIADALGSCKKVIQISGFSLLPHFAKWAYFPLLQRGVYKKHISETLGFHHASLVLNRPGPPKVFKYYHLPIPHRPLIFDENLIQQVLPFNRANFKRQAKGALRVATDFLDKLKAAGIYDQTMIWIVGDHGAGAQGLRIQLPNGGPFAGFGVNTYWWQANGTPLVLVKPFGSRGTFKHSDTPISLKDIRDATLRELRNPSSGISLFDLETDERTRFFFLYADYDNKSDRYLLKDRIRIKGHSWDSRSWVPDYASGLETLKRYQWGDRIDFGKNGNAGQYGVWHGFSVPEEGYTWTEGTVASIGLGISAPNRDLILRMRAKPLLAGNIHRQAVFVLVNEHSAGKWEMDRKGEYSLNLGKSVVSGPVLEIVFHLPQASSPKTLGINLDERLLAVALESLVIEERD